MKTDVWI
ncbi:hypothetical protein CGLO_14240 [Colletotrichum gloeosporioides Cg-14]|nr:hypothetical protein CGLO_14240 [Colletotrichum gloeosporioides Cg-14]